MSEGKIVTAHYDTDAVKNRKFFLFATGLFASFSAILILSFGYFIYDLGVTYLGNPQDWDGLSQLGFVMIILYASGFGGLVGSLIALIPIRHLGKRWGKDLEFGKHPVLKLTLLAFFTSVVLLFILLVSGLYVLNTLKS